MYSTKERPAVWTEDYSEFQTNANHTFPVRITYTPDCEPYDESDADNEAEYYQSKKQEFLNSAQIDPGSAEYEVRADSSDPTLTVVFDDFSAFERHRTKFVDDCASNELLRSIHVESGTPLVNH